MPKIIIANWKMNPASLKEATKLFDSILKNLNPKAKNLELVIAPPFVYLGSFSKLLKTKNYQLKTKLGSQDVFWENKGAYTGEISPKILKNLGVEYVIIGHSERRQHLKETDEIINKKVIAAVKAGLKFILCVGEDLTVRRRGKKAIENFIKNQLSADLKGIKNYKLIAKNLIIAYEPVWAISSNKNAKPDTPEDAVEIINFIKKILLSKFYFLNSKIIYGGSVDAKNIESFLKYKEIDGALVGGASLTSDFIKIIKIAQKYE